MPLQDLPTLLIVGLFGLFVLLPASVANAQAPDAPQPTPKHLFILSGQSNMRGPLPESFQHCVEEVFGRGNVICVTVAHPGQPIKRWHRDWTPPQGMVDEHPEHNGTLYDTLIRATRRRVGDTPIASVNLIWMQGEADANAGWSSVYTDSFHAVLDQLKADLDVDELNFVVGRINDFWTPENNIVEGAQMRAVLAALGDDNDNGAWINTDDLNRGVNPWGGYSFDDGHFPPSAYVVMGQRFARAACRLIDPDIELDEAVFHEVFFDRADDIATHGGIGKAVTCNRMVEGLEALTDGAIGEADPADDAWVRLLPAEEPIVLTVDLGEVMDVEQIAANLLFESMTPPAAGVPARLVITTSVDGADYAPPGRHESISFSARPTRRELGELAGPTTLLALIEQNARQRAVRYIRFEIQTAGQPVLIDELIVNPRPE